MWISFCDPIPLALFHWNTTNQLLSPAPRPGPPLLGHAPYLLVAELQLFLQHCHSLQRHPQSLPDLRTGVRYDTTLSVYRAWCCRSAGPAILEAEAEGTRVHGIPRLQR